MYNKFDILFLLFCMYLIKINKNFSTIYLIKKLSKSIYNKVFLHESDKNKSIIKSVSLYKMRIPPTT